jgi:nucleoside-diphosphate-sugar epimerase
VYGVPKEVPLKETSAAKPIGDYGRSKLLAEDACREYSEKFPGVVILRPRFIVGPGRMGLLTILFDWIRKGKNIYTIGSGANRYQMVGVQDLVDACVLAMERGNSGIYNIGADTVPTVRELLCELIAHAGTGSRVIATDARLARGALMIFNALSLSPLVGEHYLIGDKDYIVDTSKAKRELGWFPRQSHREMLNGAYDWYLGNKESIRTGSRSDFPREKALRILRWFS